MADNKNGKMSRSEAGKMGAKAQPRSAKVAGGRNSRRNDTNTGSTDNR